MTKRYIINERDKTGHDRTNLHESCNTDDIEQRGEADETEWLKLLEEGAHACKHCCGARPENE